MTSKAERKRKARAAKAKAHPMSAGQREPNGRASRAIREPADCGPTPETAAKLEQSGPSCIIQRAVWAKDIASPDAQGLETFASIRRIIGVAEYRPVGVVASMLPGSVASLSVSDRHAWAMEAYRAAVKVLDPIPGALDACQDACDNRPPRSTEALAKGARELRKLFIDGMEKAAGHYALYIPCQLIG